MVFMRLLSTVYDSSKLLSILCFSMNLKLPCTGLTDFGYQMLAEKLYVYLFLQCFSFGKAHAFLCPVEHRECIKLL